MQFGGCKVGCTFAAGSCHQTSSVDHNWYSITLGCKKEVEGARGAGWVLVFFVPWNFGAVDVIMWFVLRGHGMSLLLQATNTSTFPKKLVISACPDHQTRARPLSFECFKQSVLVLFGLKNVCQKTYKLQFKANISLLSWRPDAALPHTDNQLILPSSYPLSKSHQSLERRARSGQK